MLNTKYSSLRNPSNQIIAELSGSNICSTLGITARGNAPVLELCRKLVVAGYDPATPVECWRGSTLCLRVRGIGEAAALELNSKTTGFVTHRRVWDARAKRAPL